MVEVRLVAGSIVPKGHLSARQSFFAKGSGPCEESGIDKKIVIRRAHRPPRPLYEWYDPRANTGCLDTGDSKAYPTIPKKAWAGFLGKGHGIAMVFETYGESMADHGSHERGVSMNHALLT